MTNLKVIRAGRLIDGTGAAVQHDRAVYVENGRIIGIEPAGDPPADAEVINLPDSSVLPGLIDGHVHLVFSAGTYPLGDLEVENDQRLLLRGVAAARQALGAGITTVRDLGGRGGVTFRLREGITAGLIAGPRILAAGSPITITGGHCHFLGLEADDEAGVRAAECQRAHGLPNVKDPTANSPYTPGHGFGLTGDEVPTGGKASHGFQEAAHACRSQVDAEIRASTLSSLGSGG